MPAGPDVGKRTKKVNANERNDYRGEVSMLPSTTYVMVTYA